MGDIVCKSCKRVITERNQAESGRCQNCGVDYASPSLMGKTEPVADVLCNVGLSAEHTPSHVIVFEDNDQRLEPFWDEAVARARLDALGDNWTCHLYKLVESR